MDDRELADAVVALGMGEHVSSHSPCPYYAVDSSDGLTLSEFLADPSVAMALMERCWSVDIAREANGYVVSAWASEDGCELPVDAPLDSLPRAIIEATVQALREGGK